jgi:hypothetical protein
MALTPTGSLINNFDTEWTGVLQEQAPKFLAGYVDETIRRRLLLSWLRRNGRIILNQGGPMCIWSIKFSQPPVQSIGDAGFQQFNRWQTKRQAALDWRGYAANDSMSLKEYLMNKGPGQIFNRYGEIIPDLMASITDHFGGQLLIDGNGTNNANCIHGAESFLAAGACTVSDLVAVPSDDYAGLSTALQAEGGTWSTNLATADRPNATIATDWPHGTGRVEYDFNSPKLINWSSSRWGTQSTSWEANCERALRQTKLWMANLGGESGQNLVCLMGQDLYAGVMNHFASKFRSLTPHKASEDLGFSDALNFEGMALMYDYEVPPNTFYVFDVRMMELASLDTVLFGYRGPDYSFKERAWLFDVGFFGNCRYRPKHFAKGKNYASS